MNARTTSMSALVATKANALGSTRPVRRSTIAMTASVMIGHSLSRPRRPDHAGVSSTARTSRASPASHGVPAARYVFSDCWSSRRPASVSDSPVRRPRSAARSASPTNSETSRCSAAHPSSKIPIRSWPAR